MTTPTRPFNAKAASQKHNVTRLLTLVFAIFSSFLLAGCTNGEEPASGTSGQNALFRVDNLGNSIALPVRLLENAHISNTTGLAFLLEDGRSINIDTRTHDDFDEPFHLPHMPRYVFGLLEPATDQGISEHMVDQLQQLRGITLYAEDGQKKVREFDTEFGKGYMATTDDEAFIYLITDGYDSAITEIYILNFTASEIESWVDQGHFR